LCSFNMNGLGLANADMTQSSLPPRCCTLESATCKPSRSRVCRGYLCSKLRIHTVEQRKFRIPDCFRGKDTESLPVTV
jgi:hypothetical protein